MIRHQDVKGLHAATLTASAGSGELDLAPYAHVGGREMKAFLTGIPSGADTDETLNYKMQESTSTADGDYTDITGAAFTEIAQEDTPALQEIHFQASKRYVRGYATLAGTTPSFAIASGIVAMKRASST